jgi:hypothetical protein
MPESSESGANRHVDPGLPLGSYSAEVLCECPNCGGPARVRASVLWAVPISAKDARAQCLRCSFSRELADDKWRGSILGCRKQPCPNCGHKWLIAEVWRKRPTSRPKKTEKVCCPLCRKTSELQLEWFKEAHTNQPVDPHFGFPLWLRSDCRGKVFWAYNRRHLNAIKSYVAAARRVRGSASGKWSMVARLPTWVKLAKNREAVLKCISRLEAKLDEAELI